MHASTQSVLSVYVFGSYDVWWCWHLCPHFLSCQTVVLWCIAIVHFFQIFLCSRLDSSFSCVIHCAFFLLLFFLTGYYFYTHPFSINLVLFLIFFIFNMSPNSYFITFFSSYLHHKTFYSFRSMSLHLSPIPVNKQLCLRHYVCVYVTVCMM